MQVNSVSSSQASHTTTTRYPILTVSQINQCVKNSLEMTYKIVYLQGEITNLKIQSSGHAYFSLKDDSSQIAAVMFKGDLTTLTKLPKHGDHVMVLGSITVYSPKGNYQILVRQLRYMGVGELLQQLEQLKLTLKERGWFDPIYKKPLPKLPKKIGVITSATGAVIQDIIHVLNRRFSNVHLLLNPVKVQGNGAAEEIALAIRECNKYALVDVLIVGRGGGSLEDLWPFNEEIVAKAIFESKIPIISAVGHETDYSISDFTADFRAPTPSAAAECVIGEKSAYQAYLTNSTKRLEHALVSVVKRGQYQLQSIVKHSYINNPQLFLIRYTQRFDLLKAELEKKWMEQSGTLRQKLYFYKQHLQHLNPVKKLQEYRRRICEVQTRLTIKQLDLMQHKQLELKSFSIKRFDTLLLQNIGRLKERLSSLATSIDLVSPEKLFRKGYSLIKDEKGQLIHSIEQIYEQQPLLVQLSDGKIEVTVNKIQPN